MTGHIESFGVRLNLFVNGCSNGGGEVTAETEVTGHLPCKCFWGICRVIDIPVELISELMLSDGDVEFDLNAHLVVFIRAIGKLGIEIVFVKEWMWVKVFNLFQERLMCLLTKMSGRFWRYLEVFYQALYKQLRWHNAIMDVPGEGIS